MKATFGPCVLFVNHTSTGAGAELVLLDLVQAWAGASAYLFEDGPLSAEMRGRGVRVQVSRWGGGLAAVRRDSSLWRALPLAGRLAATTAGLARAETVLAAWPGARERLGPASVDLAPT